MNDLLAQCLRYLVSAMTEFYKWTQVLQVLPYVPSYSKMPRGMPRYFIGLVVSTGRPLDWDVLFPGTEPRTWLCCLTVGLLFASSRFDRG